MASEGSGKSENRETVLHLLWESNVSMQNLCEWLKVSISLESVFAPRLINL